MPTGVAIGVPFNYKGLDSLTKAYIAGMTTKPSSAHIQLIDKLVRKIKSIILKSDVIYLGNINNSNDSFRNLAKNAHHGTIEKDTGGAGLIFDPYCGFNNPDGTGYINTHYNPYSDHVNYSQNNGTFGLYLMDNYNNTSISIGICGVLATYGMRITMNISGQMLYYMNNSMAATMTVPFRAGLHTTSRNNSSTITISNNNVADTNASLTATGLPNDDFYLFRTNGSATSYLGGINFLIINDYLTSEERIVLSEAVNDYYINCLFLKYGADNWGVKMAKSYFLTLHNFEKYEAWEVYEFIKRHQEDYLSNNKIPAASAYFDTDGTAWWSVGSGTKAYNDTDKCMQLLSSGTSFLYRNEFYNYNTGYRIRFKFRSATYTGKIKVYFGGSISTYLSENTTTEWQQYDKYVVGTNTILYMQLNTSHVGIVEFDDIEVFEEGYYYKLFSSKTVADYIMAFKAGGNLISNTWYKSGDTLRWNRDGTVTASNTMSAYTRNTNLGIVTVTSTDGWDGVTFFYVVQTVNSIDSFYGNLPRFYGTLKKSGSRCSMAAYYNRIKINTKNQPLADLCKGLHLYISSPGYNKINIADLLGGEFSYDIALYGDLFLSSGKVSGNISQFTNELKAGITQFIIKQDKAVYGELTNINSLPSTLTVINFENTSITRGLSIHNRNIGYLMYTECLFDSDAIEDQLRVIDECFTLSNVPIKNLTVNMSGTGMGTLTAQAIVHRDTIIAEHVAAGYSATIITN